LLANKLSNALIVSDKDSEKNFSRSARNIKNIKIISDDGANIYDMLKYTNVIFTSSSIKKIENRILDEKN
jgi:ribosomal protein L4